MLDFVVRDLAISKQVLFGGETCPDPTISPEDEPCPDATIGEEEPCPDATIGEEEPCPDPTIGDDELCPDATVPLEAHGLTLPITNLEAHRLELNRVLSQQPSAS